MKKLKTLYEAFLCPLGLCFTFTILLFYAVGGVARGSGIALEAKQIWLILFFSALFSLSGLIFRTSLNMIVKVTLHFASTAFAFVFCLVFLSGYFEKTSGGLIISLIYAMLYLVIALVVFGVRALIGKKKNEESGYDRQFEKLRKD